MKKVLNNYKLNNYNKQLQQLKVLFWLSKEA